MEPNSLQMSCGLAYQPINCDLFVTQLPSYRYKALMSGLFAYSIINEMLHKPCLANCRNSKYCIECGMMLRTDESWSCSFFYLSTVVKWQVVLPSQSLPFKGVANSPKLGFEQEPILSWWCFSCMLECVQQILLAMRGCWSSKHQRCTLSRLHWSVDEWQHTGTWLILWLCVRICVNDFFVYSNVNPRLLQWQRTTYHLWW